MSKMSGTGGSNFKKAAPTPKGAMTTKPIQIGANRTVPPKGATGIGGASKPVGIGGAIKAIGKAAVGSKATPSQSPKPTPQQKQNQRIDAINQIVPGVTFKKK